MTKGKNPKPTTANPGRKARKVRQRKRERYQKLREDLQLSGDIPTAPEGAIRAEVVDPATQGEQPLPGLISRAMTGWAVPEHKKPELVQELVGIVENKDIPAVPKVMAMNALIKGDQLQWERDHPEEVARRGAVNVGVQVNNQVEQLNWAALIGNATSDRDTIAEQIAAVQAEAKHEQGNGQTHDDQRGSDDVPAAEVDRAVGSNGS